MKNTNTIPTIMLTARAEMKDKHKALRLGVDDYMTKPFEEEELFARISNLLKNARERKKWITEAEPELEATTEKFNFNETRSGMVRGTRSNRQ